MGYLLCTYTNNYEDVGYEGEDLNEGIQSDNLTQEEIDEIN